MVKAQRPTLTPPPARGIFEDMVDEAQGKPPVQAAAPPAERVTEPEPEAPVPAAPSKEIEAAPAVQVAVPDGRPVARRRAPAARTQSVVVPPAPAGFLTSKKPLQVKMDPQQHWDLRSGTFMRGRDMSSVVSALVSAFNADPDLWLALIDRANEDRVSLGEVLAPALEQLRDR
ncbi:hypothetical protein OOJ91_33935 [Micromonospora lupini]|uniref:hypothetical protein n=1 Tax=Micromonospora lupini TaxID=285679 RepID=UPI0022579D71|nr:hypothetical protein [Micromonospora lupini]MCX5070849.1 hypothetical protein [Micromonospora lupini]